MFVYSPPGSRPSGVERKTEYAADVARTAGARTTYPRMTLGPVRCHASPVTLKIPAPIRMPSRVAYDSIVPRSRRRPVVIGWVEDTVSALLQHPGSRSRARGSDPPRSVEILFVDGAPRAFPLGRSFRPIEIDLNAADRRGGDGRLPRQSNDSVRREKPR